MSKNRALIQLQFIERSTTELRGRQSVRTTFKLSARCIDALSLLASQLGIKQKSLFDHLVNDVQALQAIAKDFDSFSSNRQRIAKTYVISRRALENLEKVSARFHTPRDALVEFSIESILPLIEVEKTKHRERKQVVENLTNQLQTLSKIYQQAVQQLGDEDPICQELGAIQRQNSLSFARMLEYMEKSKKIEEF